MRFGSGVKVAVGEILAIKISMCYIYGQRDAAKLMSFFRGNFMLLTTYGTHQKSIITDTLERLRLTAGTSSHDWLDILQLSWMDYHQIRSGKLPPSAKLIERVAEHFHLKPKNILYGKIDYTSLALEFEAKDLVMPERYSKAAFGRKRTSISSIQFVEKYAGWRLRHHALHKLSVSESMLQDPFSPISMKFITDLCGYLHRRQFQKADFFMMGAYSYVFNKNSLIADLFFSIRSPKEAYEFFFNDCMKLFEQNCTYTITKISNTALTLEYITNPDVAAESGIRHLGSTHVCKLKMGVFANIPRYLGLPPAKAKEVACVHWGDDICRHEIIFTTVLTI